MMTFPLSSPLCFQQVTPFPVASDGETVMNSPLSLLTVFAAAVALADVGGEWLNERVFWSPPTAIRLRSMNR
jgi:hypothetical protein